MPYSYNKSVGICGFPGGGKTWCIMYRILYDISKVLRVNSTDMMCKCDIQIGGIHIHKLFKILTKYNMTPHRRSYLAILKLIKKPQ